MREDRIRETGDHWASVVLPYQENLKLNDIRSHVFQMAARRHPGHPYKAARELGVAPVTFYRWNDKGDD